MNKKNITIIGGAAVTAAATAGAALWGLRRYVPKAKSFSGTVNKVQVSVLTVGAGDHTIYGELMRPAGTRGPLPTVICCHGFGANYMLCKMTMAKCFAMSGLQAYVFDFHGGNLRSRSGGKMTNMSIFTERDDLNAVIDAVASLPDVDPENLFLLGGSQGGCESAITAPYHKDQIKAMVLYYPAFCIPEDAQKRHATVDDIPKTEKVFGMRVGKVYSEKLLDYDVFKEIAAYDKPVLIIHGDADKVVPIEYGKRAEAVYEDVEFITMEGEDHGFSAKGKLIASEQSYRFIMDNID